MQSSKSAPVVSCSAKIIAGVSHCNLVITCDENVFPSRLDVSALFDDFDRGKDCDKSIVSSKGDRIKVVFFRTEGITHSAI